MLSVSLVIPVLNASRTLPLLFQSLDRLAPPPLEILLVDNGSTDGSVELLQSFARDRANRGVRVLEEPKRGAPAARNRGLGAARGDLVAFTDADCSPTPEWLRHILRALEEPAIGAVAGRVVGAAGASILEVFSSLYTLRLPEEPAQYHHWSPESGGFPTANLAVRRTLAEELDGFDEGVDIYGEDYDFCARLYARGVVVAYQPEAVVAHHHRQTLAGMMRQAFGFGRGHAFLFRRHGKGLLWIDLPRYTVRRNNSPLSAWLDLASADKRILFLAVLAALYLPLGILLPAYALFLLGSVRRRSRQAGMTLSVWMDAGLTSLLVLKSAALTLGRWWGSLKYRTICL